MSKKTKIVVLTILLLVIMIGSIGGYFIYKYMEQNKSTGTTWGDTYYAYLKEATSKENYKEKEKYGIQEDMKNTQLQFCYIEKDAPAMVMTYEKYDQQYVNTYEIAEDGKVVNVAYKEPSTVEFLYDIQEQSYSWYVHLPNYTQDSYKPILAGFQELTATTKENTNVTSNKTAEANSTSANEANRTAITPEYTFQKEEKTMIETISGETISISKFDEIFIKPEIDNSEKINIDINNINEKDMKNSIKKAVSNYKTEEEIVTQEMKTEISKKVTEVENKQAEIKKAQEEKAAVEEAIRIKSEEEAKKMVEVAQSSTTTTTTGSSGKITVEEARKLAQKIDGTKSSETGYEIGYTHETNVRDATGKQYYLFRVAWLVEDHWSTIDGIAIAMDGKTWKQVDIYERYQEGDVIKEVYQQGSF